MAVSEQLTLKSRQVWMALDACSNQEATVSETAWRLSILGQDDLRILTAAMLNALSRTI